ncbi:PREDICTED: uncharacterized protein LOC107163731 [Diuraphis noxia]|uniref:uncharacterized protein LOC107163731 n=1 Tax=Diuraphis noxia TaxID=143948 RepID=UPI00076368B9|nr:PREDICTED: uncharacterized protein LOC107163731 [Diuraphis noxia]
MFKPKKNNNPSKKRDNDAPPKTCEYEPKPTLYSSVIQTESKLRNISLSRLEPKPNTIKGGVREVNFPLTKHVYDYNNMVNVGLNSNSSTVTKPKPREPHSTKKTEPKLSDYYTPSFDNVQRIQMDSVKTNPELTVQYDGLAVTRLLNEIDDLIFI